MVSFMNADTPNFIWNNVNAKMDMDCIIENEIAEVSPAERTEAVSIVGRHGELNETFGDYAAYDLPIPNISIPYGRLQEVKRWLRGNGKLITHNDSDKYRDCICNMEKSVEFENEWGVFYSFDLNFRCQPFRKKVRDIAIPFGRGLKVFDDPGDEVASPFFEIEATGGDFAITLGDRSLVVINALPGTVTVDVEMGKVVQGSAYLFSKGEWPKVMPGENELITSGALTGGTIQRRSLFL